MADVTNIAAYKFAPLCDLKPLREHLLARCLEWDLKGTILVSTEGVNLFVAGSRNAVDDLLQYLRSIPGLDDLQAKFSRSAKQPFAKMRVKIKQEIIAFGVPEIDPARHPAPRLSPKELKQWLDEGREVLLLDTRNNYEVQLGTFANAVTVNIDHFRDFPNAIADLPRDDRPIVSFCTGGIRCEKAAPFLQHQGFTKVYQLDGGILKYFEECGHAHYQGECFVFDQRVGLAADLGESAHGFCTVCQHLLTPEEMTHAHFVANESCPYCYRSPHVQQVSALAEHRERLRELCTTMPGRDPQTNFRPLKIRAHHAGLTMGDYLASTLGHVAPVDWRKRLDQGEVVDGHHQPVAATQIVQPGERYFTREHWQVEPDVNLAIEIIHEDEAIIVLHKPAPLPMHPSGRFNRNTLQAILQTIYAPQKPRPAHRLDANTSGLAVFSRTANFAKLLQPQFEASTVVKRYLARIIGHPPTDDFTCDAPITIRAGQHGSRRIATTEGLEARTSFTVRHRFPDGTALLEVTPHTGRTNQIRVHLWHLGFPIVGDPMYREGGALGEQQTLTPNDPPLCLHAWQLTFTHPQTGERVTYEATPPGWAEVGV